MTASVIALPAKATAYAEREQPSAIAPWIEATLAEIASNRINPPRAARALALVSVAMHDAVRGRGNRGGDAAAAGAASTVLTYLFPAEGGRFLALAGEKSRKQAFRRGQRVGARIVARARQDGSDADWSGRMPSGPGVWTPTPPAFLSPLEPLVGTWRTWNLRSGSQFRPAPPPTFAGERFRAEAREVYDVSRSLTPEQKRIADFWADGVGTVTPPGHWNQIALELVHWRRLSTRASARVFATLNTAQADAFIACWDAKFTYWSERPITTIRREFDPTWQSYITTPPFPSYVSGHATTSGAASAVLARFFPAARAQLQAWAAEAAVSRLYGGIHFRSDNEIGLQLGQRVGRAALRSRFAQGRVGPLEP